MNQQQHAWRRLAATAAGLLASLFGAAYAALLLAEFGVFRPWPCILFAAAAGLLAARWTSARFVPLSAKERTGWIAAAVLAAGSLALSLPPAEMLLGGWDPGVYLHAAAAVSERGSLQIPAPDVFALPESLRADLVVEIAGWRHPFPGMFPLPGGRLSPQFMHLYPSLLAVAHSFGGVWGALCANPLLNVAAILAAFAFASRLLGPRWGLLAAFLLAVNPAQVWQSRFGTAEILGQILLLAASSLLLDAERRPGGRAAAAVSGVLFGLAFFTRYDVVLFLVPLVLVLLLPPLSHERRRLLPFFLVPLAAVGLHAAWHMSVVAPCYRPLPGLVFPLLLAAAAAAAALAAAGRFFPSAAARLAAPRFLFAARAAFSAGFAALAFFFWSVRPRLASDGRVAQAAAALLDAAGHPEWLAALAGPDALNVHFLVAIFGAAGLLFAFAGVAALAWRISGRAAAAWLLASAAVLAILLANVFHDHFMMWVSRRFVPVAVPLLAIGLAAAAREAFSLLSRRSRPAAIALAASLAAAAILPVLPKTSAMASMRDWPGLVAWFRQLAQGIPPGAVVFCDQPGFAAPLRFLHGVRAHEIHGGLSACDFALRHRQDLLRIDGTPLLLTMRSQPLAHSAACIPLATFSLSSHTQRQPRRTVPDGVKPRGGIFFLLDPLQTEKMDNPHGAPPQ